jgi:hypothetical protein
MASSGFKQPPAKGKSHAKAQRDEKDAKAMRLLQEMAGDSASAEKATQGVDTSETMNTRIEVSLDGKLNRERLQVLVEFYKAEKALSRAMLAFAADLNASLQGAVGQKMYQALRTTAIQEYLAKYVFTKIP